MASEGCAIGPDGELLNASKIDFFNDPDDDEPIAPATRSVNAPTQLHSPLSPQTHARMPSTCASVCDMFILEHVPTLIPLDETHHATPSSPVQVRTPYEPEPDPRFGSYKFRFRVRKIL